MELDGLPHHLPCYISERPTSDSVDCLSLGECQIPYSGIQAPCHACFSWQRWTSGDPGSSSLWRTLFWRAEAPGVRERPDLESREAVFPGEERSAQPLGGPGFLLQAVLIVRPASSLSGVVITPVASCGNVARADSRIFERRGAFRGVWNIRVP